MADQKSRYDVAAERYARLIGLMQTSPYTPLELSAKTGLSIRVIHATLKALHESDPKVAYIASWTRLSCDNKTYPRWRFGTREDATKPVRLPVGPTSIFNLADHG